MRLIQLVARPFMMRTQQKKPQKALPDHLAATTTQSTYADLFHAAAAISVIPSPCMHWICTRMMFERQPMTPSRSYQWLSVAIRSYQWLSVAIGGLVPGLRVSNTSGRLNCVRVTFLTSGHAFGRTSKDHQVAATCSFAVPMERKSSNRPRGGLSRLCSSKQRPATQAMLQMLGHTMPCTAIHSRSQSSFQPHHPQHVNTI